MIEVIAEVLEDKKAKDTEIIDIKELTILADYFIICSGTSTRHVKSLADAVEEKLEELGIFKSNKEGYDSAGWILLDYGDVVVHIFREEERQYYNIERLWSDGVLVSRERERNVIE
jgi:ribosome-associated protein